MPELPGIYCIHNSINDYRYIGSSSWPNTRIKDHIRILNKNRHICKKLQADWNKYGANAFSFTILEIVNDRKDSIRLQREQYYIDSYSLLYNQQNAHVPMTLRKFKNVPCAPIIEHYPYQIMLIYILKALTPTK